MDTHYCVLAYVAGLLLSPVLNVFIFTVHKSAVSFIVMSFMFVCPDSVTLIALSAMSHFPPNSGIQLTEPRKQCNPIRPAFRFIYSPPM
jgi:hypothetical protein